MSRSSGYWQVKIVNTDGSGQRPLTDDWYWNGLPAWSPDGDYIVFVSTRDDNWPDRFELIDNAAAKLRLWIMDADGGNQRLLNEFAFRLDGVPAGVPAYQVEGWIAERLVWLPAEVYRVGTAARTACRCASGAVVGITQDGARIRPRPSVWARASRAWAWMAAAGPLPSRSRSRPVRKARSVSCRASARLGDVSRSCQLTAWTG